MTEAWPSHMETDLRVCVADGLSSGRTAQKLGITRSAVIGKAHRLGLQWRNAAFNRGGATVNKIKAKGRQERARKPQMGRAFYAPQEPLPPTDAPRAIPPAPNSKPVDLMGLTNSTCRWPVTEDPPHMFCGALEADNPEHPYCPYHEAASVGRNYVPLDRRQKQREASE